jgi:hypothetical protein
MKLVRTLHRLPPRLLALGVVVAAAIMVLPATVFAAPTKPASCDLACIIHFGDTRINDRLTALTNLSNRVTNALNNQRITQGQATPLQSDISTNQSGLTHLKSTLDGETAPRAALQDVRNIYLQFRIYAVVLPRDNHQLWLDMLSNAAGKLAGLEPTIQTALDHAPAGLKGQLNNLFSDYKAQIAEAQAQIAAGQGQLSVLTVANFNNNRTTYLIALNDLRSDTRTAQRDIKQAIRDLHQIHLLLKGSDGGGATPSPSV